MKILIVDDEEHVREAVELSINWEKYNITTILTAEEGEAALEIVRDEQPELIICDMSMPRMDGETFLKILRKEGWEAQVIVLSGYQEFRYTRATLLANGVDYLLKPFKKDDLDQAIARAVSFIVERKQTVGEEIQKNYQLYEANALLDEQKAATYLQSDNVNYDGIKQLLVENGFSSEEVYVQLFLPRNLSMIVDRYMGDEGLLFFVTKNILNEIFEPIAPFYFFRYESFFCLFIEATVSLEQVASYQDKLIHSWLNVMKLKTISAFSKVTYPLHDIHSGIKDCKTEMLQKNILDNGESIHKKIASAVFMDKEILILEAIKKRDKQYIEQLMKAFVTELREQQYVSLKELQHYTIEVNLLIMRISEQLSQYEHIEPVHLWLSELEEWEKSLISMFSLIIDSAGDNSNELQGIKAIRHYIERHLHEEISLSALSDMFYFSPQYISKKFKENYNTTIMNYLSQLRMEKASTLLAQTELTIQEIAGAVGYEDDNYFGKVFRKYYNISPSQYRKINK